MPSLLGSRLHKTETLYISNSSKMRNIFRFGSGHGGKFPLSLPNSNIFLALLEGNSREFNVVILAKSSQVRSLLSFIFLKSALLFWDNIIQSYEIHS